MGLIEIFFIFVIGFIAWIFIANIIAKFKVFKFNSVAFFDGAVKSGKTTICVYCAYRKYKSNLRKWKIRKFFRKLFNIKRTEEKPLLYSNIPLSVPYVELTQEILERSTRPNFKSVILIDEASIVADSQLIRDKNANNNMLLFYKLIGHETHGGNIFINSQSNADIHYSIKRVLSEYIYVHHMVKWIPFILIAYVREDRMEEGVINVNTSDVEDTLKKVIISKRAWKLFDTYAFSSLTDNLKRETKVVKGKKNLKIKKVLSFREDFAKLVAPQQEEEKGDENGTGKN